MGRILDRIPWPPLVLFAVLMALAPFRPEPHLVEKFRMLFQGTLRRPVDGLDLLFHLAPAFLMLAKALRKPG